MGMTAVSMTVVMEQEKPYDIGCQTEASYDQHQLRVGDFLRFDKSLYGFEKYGQA
jgi:hypothetical protein